MNHWAIPATRTPAIQKGYWHNQSPAIRAPVVEHLVLPVVGHLHCSAHLVRPVKGLPPTIVEQSGAVLDSARGKQCRRHRIPIKGLYSLAALHVKLGRLVRMVLI